MAVHMIRLEVRLPKGHWAGDVTRENPNAVLRIEETMALSKGRGSAKASCTDDISKTIIDHVAIEDFREIDSNRFSVDIGAKGGAFPKPMLDVGVIPHTPFEVRDGWVDWTIECSRANARELIQQFKDQSIPHRLISTRPVSSKLLTKRQSEVFEVALREGYYEVPRRITLTEMASLLGVAKSTLSNQLQRMESTILHTFADDVRRRSGK